MTFHFSVGVCVDERGLGVSVTEPFGEERQRHTALAAGLFVIRSEKSWRRAGVLGRKGLPWLQLTATVRGHKSGMFHEAFILEGEGSKDQPVTFQIRLHPWAGMPKPGQKLTFYLLSDGSSAAILALGERPWYRLATISTPYVAPRPLSG